MPMDPAVTTYHEWLSADVGRERTRSIAANNRITSGIADWDLSWLEGEGVVAYERAAGRVRQERPGGGPVTAGFARGLVHTESLPTAVASPSDHYVVVSAVAPPRFMSVEEVCRSMGVPRSSPVVGALIAEDTCTAIQAVSALGDAVHVGAVRRLIRHLADAGAIAPGLTYGSAYSGVDLVAAAVDAEMDGDWHYEFASETDAPKRKVLARAWGGRGLQGGKIFYDAAGDEAVGAPSVDLWVMTASCKQFSRRNHAQSEDEQWSSLTEVHRCLDYVRHSTPGAILVENVTEDTVVKPLTEMLTRLPGYTWEVCVMDPKVHARAPITRERFYWLGRRL